MVRLRCDPWLEPIYRLRLLMPAEPHIRSPFPERLDTTIPHSRGHRARDGGSTLYFGISQPLFVTVRSPGSNGADQALVELRGAVKLGGPGACGSASGSVIGWDDDICWDPLCRLRAANARPIRCQTRRYRGSKSGEASIADHTNRSALRGRPLSFASRSGRWCRGMLCPASAMAPRQGTQ